INQLIELLTHYGPVFSVWLDGACGEGPNGKVQVYDWQRIYDTVRALAPEAVISVCGPDVRWCGNEAGSVRANEWSVVPASLREAERTAEKSQKADDGEFSRQVASGDEDLGSREALAGYCGPLAWYPAEVNTSTRKGWFHHDVEDSQVRSVDELFSIWKGSVGGNATFLLNVPPNRDGLLADADVEVLARLGEKIADFRARRIEAFRKDDGNTVTLRFDTPRTVSAVVLEEDIAQGQRIDEAVVASCANGGDEQEIARAHSVGYRRIITLEKPVTATQVRVTVTKSRQGFYLADAYVIEA
ncbi:MAG: alpha-L-fucosidase, partial [Schaalia sp.]|nr:alpha-L-fucosidase [Schaalia sp.]